MIKNILFDLDGTLTDPKEGITKSIQHVFTEFELPTPNTEDLLWCIGPPILESMGKLIPNKNIELAVKLYRKRYSEVGLFENQVYPGIENMLISLNKKKYRLFVATAKPTIYSIPILKYFNLDMYFEGIHGSELDGTNSDKRDLISHIINVYKLNVKETVMVGDRAFDIDAAHENKLKHAIAVAWGYGNDSEFNNSRANFVAKNMTELETILINLGELSG